jgi:hypothetical protein
MTKLALAPQTDATDSDHTSLRALVDQHAEPGDTPTVAAARLLDRYGPELFNLLSREAVLSMLAAAVRALTYASRKDSGLVARRDVRETGEVVVPVIRIAAAGKAYWSTRWRVAGGQEKETRELTIPDVEYLIRRRQSQREELRAQIVWLLACVKIARQHKAATLGDLEKRGIALPTIEIDEDA